MCERLVLTGDSITAWGRADPADPHDLGTGYVSLLARERLDGLEVLNTGIGGDRLADLAARWEKDVLALEPDAVSVYIGINDTWRHVDSGLDSPVDRFEEEYRSLIEPLAASGTTTVLVSPFVLPAPGEDRDWEGDLGPRAAAIERLAADTGSRLVRLQEPMTRLAALTSPSRVALDGVHPTMLGHALIADLWWDAWTR
ncbi:SGNH/GDSL hydrolase family protein [Actinomyces oricola]|uniref:SGNH/GDSL hydrolase family protein n=1 Tax=Actinomyces oricola TaxID=206043 RepID=UPI000FFE9495|nr:SGNH/GDSL hydrolase family protein [Actinomyces oricola]